MNSLQKLLQWLVITMLFPLGFLNIWLLVKIFQYFQSLITILVLATLLAFILNYPVRFVQERGIKRDLAVALVFLPTLVILVILGTILVPMLLTQFQEMAKVLPQWLDSGNEKIALLNDWALNHGLPVNLTEMVSQLIDRFPTELESFAKKFFSIVLSAIDSISELLVTVVFTFYILLDGERIWQGIFQKLPSSLTAKVKNSLSSNFQNYLIGQIVLSFLVGCAMTTMFLALKVKFGLLFGLTIGIMALIPFGDVISLGTIALLVASHDFWLGVRILAIATAIDQIIDQIIAPRLLGRFTGLRPIWVLISLLIGTSVGGLLGLLLAVPLAGFIKDAADGWQDPAYAADAPEVVTIQQNHSTSESTVN